MTSFTPEEDRVFDEPPPVDVVLTVSVELDELDACVPVVCWVPVCVVVPDVLLVPDCIPSVFSFCVLAVFCMLLCSPLVCVLPVCVCVAVCVPVFVVFCPSAAEIAVRYWLSPL